MKINRIVLTLTIGGLTLLNGELLAQRHTELEKREHQRYDSVQKEIDKAAVIQGQKQEDANRIEEAKAVQQETKEIAKETQRIDREASSAAREARMALKAEKKAQKARKDADSQARKAVRAKNRSDKNKS